MTSWILALSCLLQDGGAEAPRPEPAKVEAGEDESATAPAAKETVQLLEALVIEVKGRVQWQAVGEEKWKLVALDDRMKPGAKIRTGLRSSLALRVGKNATLRIGRSSRIELPTIVEKDGKLQTRALFHRGRADIKVDQVGLENDFLVVTPTSTLAVKGTGFRLEWGRLFGTKVEGLPTNQIRSIEMRYFGRPPVMLSGADASTDASPQPSRFALGRTVAPPPAPGFAPIEGAGPRLGPLPRDLERNFRSVRNVEKGGSEVGQPPPEDDGGGSEGPPPHGGG